MSFQFCTFQSKKLYVSNKECKSVIFAVKDLIRDLSKLRFKISLTDNPTQADVIVASMENNENLFDEFSSKSLTNNEEYIYEIKDGKIFLGGINDLGTMWSIYTFIEKELNVSPSCVFDEYYPEQKDELIIENKVVNDFPKTKYRGVFINDEDLLCGFSNKGERNIDYFFYQKIISPNLMKKIVSTALRHKFNLIIPSTLIDILNPYEENLVKIAEERGLYVSQHHIEPLGVSKYALTNFLRDNGYGKDTSFITNKKGVVEAWRFYAKKWSKHKRVIWQLGLRGGSDVPVWKTDKNVGESDFERGKLISDAIFEQEAIIKEFCKGEIVTSMTVWMESANLLEKGVLTLPKNTILVFADIGASQMFGEDFFTVPKINGVNYGLYYHVGYWNVGAHLADCVIPNKMIYSYNLARDVGINYYSVVNVANIKEFPYSIELNSKLCFDGCVNLKHFDSNYCCRISQKLSNKISNGISIYFNSLKDVGEEEYIGFCKRNNFNYHMYENLPFSTYSINDGVLTWYIKRPFYDSVKYFNNVLKKSLENASKEMEKAFKLFKEIANELPTSKKGPFTRHLVYQSFYMLKIIKSALFIHDAVEKTYFNQSVDISKAYELASHEIKDVLDFRTACYKQGKFKNWFTFDKKIDINSIYNFLQKKIVEFKNS